MTGTFPAQVISGLADVSGTSGPAAQDQRAQAAPAAGAGAGADSGEFTVPYRLQTGLTKYASMQPVPPTKITAKQFTPLNPTSAFVKATTMLPPPTIVTTITASQTFSVESIEYTVRIWMAWLRNVY